MYVPGKGAVLAKHVMAERGFTWEIPTFKFPQTSKSKLAVTA